MKTTKEDILLTSLRPFSERGFDAVSTSLIASELGITKGALYRHFQSKQEIFESIITKMFELDEQRTCRFFQSPGFMEFSCSRFHRFSIMKDRNTTVTESFL